MRRLVVSIASGILLAGLSSAQKVHMTISINDSPVGENTYERLADGTFKTATTLHIGNIALEASADGMFKGNHLISATCTSKGPGGLSKYVYANGKVTATNPKGKSATSPFIAQALGASLLPQFWTSSLTQVVAKASMGSAEVTLRVLLVDAGADIPIKFNVLSNLQAMQGGKPRIVRRFKIDLNGITGVLDLDDADQVVGFDVPVQHLRMIADGWNGLFVDPIAKFPELSQATYKFRTESGVKMTTRDGVELACDVVHPDDKEKHPVILIRTPYGRGTETVNAGFYASRGYVVVTQDCRGREDSGGNWDPFVNEGKDGYDAVQWAASQPWSNGNVGMIGGSYDGYVQWAAAVENPPALKCIVPQVSPPDAMRNIPYDHGVFALYLDLWWAKIVAGRHTDFSSLRSSLPHPLALTSLPLSKADTAVLGTRLDFYQKWLARPTLKDWKGWDYTSHLDRVTIPVLHISGTWDGDEIGTHINWNGMRALGRKNEWIVFGPWTHAFDTTHNIGDVEYGPDAIIDLDSVYLRWFDTWLKGKPVGLDKQPHVKLFVAGANRWVSLDDWPSSTMRASKLYLNRTALTSAPGGDTSRSYTYDPAKDNKVPQVLIDMDPSKGTTKVERGELDPKTSALFEGAPFKTKTAIASPVSVDLYFKTSARDTDLEVTLLDEAPDGSFHLIGTSGRIRGTYLNGMDRVVPLKPGTVYKAEVVPWDFAYEFQPGHRLALHVRSTGFPIFSRNLGTGEPIGNATRMVAQHNTFLMGRGHPSSLSYYVLWEK
jgi:hypothetical protein